MVIVVLVCADHLALSSTHFTHAKIIYLIEGAATGIAELGLNGQN